MENEYLKYSVPNQDYLKNMETKNSDLFKSASTKDDDGFMMCSCGRSAIDNNSYVVTTHYLKADEIPEECVDAKTFSELIAKLLNEHYNK